MMDGNEVGVAMARGALIVAVLSAVLGAAVFATGHWLYSHVTIDVRWVP